MRILDTCTLRDLRANPVRTAVTVLGIVLSCALVLAVLTSAASLYRYLLECEVLSDGAYNAEGTNLSAATAATVLADEAFTLAAAARDEGAGTLAAFTDAARWDTVALVAVDASGGTDAFAELTQTAVVSGRLPQSANEIALPASVIEKGWLAANLGDELTLAMSDGGERTFTFVGTVELADGVWMLDAATLGITGADTDAATEAARQGDEEAGAARSVASVSPGTSGLLDDEEAVAASSAASASSSLQDASDADDAWRVWVATDDPAAALSLLNGRAANDAARQLSTNYYVNLLSTYALETGVSTTLFGLGAILTLVVMAAGTLFVRNSFAIAVTERTRQFGLLSTVGATRRQLRGMVLREAGLLCAVGVPAGLLLGYAGTQLVVAACAELVGTWSGGVWGRLPEGGLRAVAVPGVFALAALLAVVTALVAAWGPARRAAGLGAMAAVRSEGSVALPRGVRRAGKVWGRLFGVEGELAAKSFCREARPRRAAVASLVCAVVLVATASLFGAYTGRFFEIRGDGTESYDLSYYFYSGSQDTPIEGESNEGTAASLAQVDGVTKSMYGYLVYAATYLPENPNTPSCLYFVDDATWQGLLDSYGLAADDLVSEDGTPQALALGNVATVVDGRFAQRAAFSADELPLTFAAATDVGETVSFSCTVGALIDSPWWTGSVLQPTLIYPLGALGDVVGGVDPETTSRLAAQGAWEVRVCGDDPAALEDELVDALDVRGLSATRLYNAAESERSSRALTSTVRVFVAAFAVVVSLIALSGAFNTMYTALSRRRREFAVLCSAGLSRRGLVRLMSCECALYLVRVLAWSAPVSLAVSFAMRRALEASVEYGAGLELPWAVLPAVAVAGLVMALAAAYALRRTNAAEPVAILRAAGI